MRVARRGGYSGAELYRTFGRLNNQLKQEQRESLPPLLLVARSQAQLYTHFETMEKK